MYSNDGFCIDNDDFNTNGQEYYAGSSSQTLSQSSGELMIGMTQMSHADGTTADDDAEGRGEDEDETVEQTQTQPFSTAAAVAAAATDANSQPVQSMDTTEHRQCL